MREMGRLCLIVEACRSLVDPTVRTVHAKPLLPPICRRETYPKNKKILLTKYKDEEIENVLPKQALLWPIHPDQLLV